MNRRAAYAGCLTAAVCALAFARPAMLWAHAGLTRSEPAEHQRLRASPSAIRLWFSRAPVLATSQIVVDDSSGKAMNLGPLEPLAKLAFQAKVRSPLVPGRYTIHWRAGDADGHVTHGAFWFRVTGR